MEQDINLLHSQAARCRRLAIGAMTPGLATMLFEMADRLDGEARALERGGVAIHRALRGRHPRRVIRSRVRARALAGATQARAA